MSPPIYTPDGSEVSEIVLPDGSTASEVIGPDGNVVFEAGPDIPDSGGTHQWNTNEGSGTTLTDNIGALDGTITGASWISGKGAGEFHLNYDGTDDAVDFGTASRSEFRHFVEDGTGTVFAWINPDDVTTRQSFFGSSLSTDDVGIVFEDRPGDSEYNKFLITHGVSQEFVSNAFSESANVIANEWQPLAATCDGSNCVVYWGDPSNNYQLSQVASDTINSSNLTAGDLDQNVIQGEVSGEAFDGGIDLMWTDNVGRSQSELQTFVDDSKSFYE